MLYPKNAQAQLRDELFQNPTSEYRATPFWAWNCRLNENLLHREIEQMKRMGMGGFHMHSRSGMATPYLSDEFMALIKSCVEKARSEGMLAWLYDEDRWPSGAAGGIVTKDHAMRSRHILITPYPYGTDAPASPETGHDMGTRTGNGQLIATFSVQLLEDGTLGGYSVHPNGIGGAEGDDWYVYLEYAKDNPWYNDQGYLDTLNPEAVRRFIEVTYERYLETCGEDFGGIVPAIFTDEPQFTFKQRLGMAFDKKDVVLPWTGDLTDTFQKAYGFDILQKLPELIWDLPEDKPSRARFCYHDHVAERFAQAFADQCGAWCEQHNLSLTGHMMEEPTLQSQTAMIGDAMRSLRAFQIPGIDMLCDRREYMTAKQAQSVAKQYGREGVLSELYGVTNWDFDFRGHKLQGDWQAALGVSVRVPHLTWVSMEGEAKRDYPASIGYQSPWYEQYSLVEDHFARVNTAMTRGKPITRVGMIHPVESYWLKYGPNQNSALERQEMDNRHERIADWLLLGGIDFDFLSESLLPEQCKEGSNPLAVGEMAYDVVMVPWCQNLRSSTLDRLEAFQKAGGRLIFVGEAPKTIDAAPSDRGAKLANQVEMIPFDRARLLQALESSRDVSIVDMNTGVMTDGLLYQLRQDGDSKWLFVCQGRKPESPDIAKPTPVRIRVKGAYGVTIFDTMTGEIRPIATTQKGGWTEITYVFDLHDSLLVRLDDAIVKSKATVIFIGGQAHSDVKRPQQCAVAVELSEPNVVLLDIAEYKLDGGEWNPPEELLRADNACRKALGWPLRMSQFAQPWVVPEEPITHRFHARFAIHSEIAVQGAKLALEQAEDTRVRLNGQDVSAVTDGFYVDESIRTVPLPQIPAGESVLELDMPFGRRVGVEWCYIIGDFGVKVQGARATITEPVRELFFDDIVHQGLAFYGGNIRYRLPLSGRCGKLWLKAPQYRGALVMVDIDGKPAGQTTFSPYTIELDVPSGSKEIGLTLFGSRVNSFGAVHNCDETVKWHGPNAWRSTGDSWSYQYRLRRLGILIDPQIEEVKA